ncbi:hypothetical protein EVAR_21056_1 [Eumeta japonica]|uniref:Uncharacterized protein n=1 Tax=Eumeta variegata TaxID=151549 RepID=A0A4C1UZU2_EUMVA|nr:hypothetical protein EVAR_21056_1 [Eumeta japonica]
MASVASALLPNGRRQSRQLTVPELSCRRQPRAASGLSGRAGGALSLTGGKFANRRYHSKRTRCRRPVAQPPPHPPLSRPSGRQDT